MSTWLHAIDAGLGPLLLLVAFVDGVLDGGGNGLVGQALGPAGQAHEVQGTRVVGLPAGVAEVRESGRLR